MYFILRIEYNLPNKYLKSTRAVKNLLCNECREFSNTLTYAYDTFFVRIEYGVVPKKLTLKFRADFLSLEVFDYADYESDG